MPKVASPNGDSSRLAPCRSRVRTPAWVNFSPRLKKNPFDVLAEWHGPCGHGPRLGFFPQTEKPLLLPLNEIWWGPFQPPLPLRGRIFFLIIVLYVCHNTTSYKQQHYTTDLDYLFELNTVSSIMQIYCFCTLVEPQFSFRFFYFKVCVLAKIHQFISII